MCTLCLPTQNATYLTLLQLLEERLELLIHSRVFHLDHLVHLFQVLVLENKFDFLIESSAEWKSHSGHEERNF